MEQGGGSIRKTAKRDKIYSETFSRGLNDEAFLQEKTDRTSGKTLWETWSEPDRASLVCSDMAVHWHSSRSPVDLQQVIDKREEGV